MCPHHQYQRLRAYINSLQIEAGKHSLLVWETLKTQVESRKGCLGVPDACPGYRDNLMYTWTKIEHYLEHYLECEIFASGAIEFFYRNRKTGDIWGEDTTIEQGFSLGILDKVSIFIEQ